MSLPINMQEESKIMFSSRKRIIPLFTLFVLLFSLLGCQTQTNQTTYHETPPTIPIGVKTSFPDGAPRLNQIKELRVTVKTNSMPAKSMSVQVNLPDSFELISGSLSWTGDIPLKNEIPVIQAMVKSIKQGSYTIEVTSYIDPKEHGAFGGTGHNPIYVFVSENSAEWRYNPPYGPTGGSPLPPGQVPATSYTSASSSPEK